MGTFFISRRCYFQCGLCRHFSGCLCLGYCFRHSWSSTWIYCNSSFHFLLWHVERMVSRLLVSIGVSSICWFWTWRSTCKPHLTAAHFEFFSNFIKYASVSHNPVLVVVGWPFLSYKFHTCICTYYMCCWNPDGHWHADS
jgi:hypothetical protein